VEVLEKINNPEARQFLAVLAAGAPGHLLTKDAALILGRLKKKSGETP